MARQRKPTGVRAIPNAIGDNLRWSVHWVKPDGKGSYRIVEVDCEGDLNEALRVYLLAKGADKRFATLRCRNSGFPPPEQYAPRLVWKAKKIPAKGRRKARVERVQVKITPMRRLNAKGIAWCPYCRELRRFKRYTHTSVDTILVPADGDYCPICATSERDFHVRRWNPMYGRKHASGTKEKRSKN